MFAEAFSPPFDIIALFMCHVAILGSGIGTGMAVCGALAPEFSEHKPFLFVMSGGWGAVVVIGAHFFSVAEWGESVVVGEPLLLLLAGGSVIGGFIIGVILMLYTLLATGKTGHKKAWEEF